MKYTKYLVTAGLLFSMSWSGSTNAANAEIREVYDYLLTKLNAQKIFEFSNVEYEPGHAKSKAISAVKKFPFGSNDTLFRLEHAIIHEPANFTEEGIEFGAGSVHTSLVLTDNLKYVFDEIFTSRKNDKSILLTTDFAFDGSDKYQMFVGTIDAQKLGKEKKDHIKFDGMDYTLVLSSEKIKGKGDIGEFRTQANGSTISTTPINLSIDMEKIAESAFVGRMELGVERFTAFLANEGFIGQFHNALLSLQNTSDGDTLDSTVNVSLGKAIPKKLISRGSLSLGSKNIPLDALPGLTDLLSDSITSEKGNVTNVSFNLDALSPKTLLTVGDAYKPEAGIFYKLDMDIKDGHVNSELNLSVIDTSSSPTTPMVITEQTTLGELLNMLEVDFSFKADKEVLKDGVIDELLADEGLARFIEINGEEVQSQVSVRESIMYINGNPVSLKLMMGEALDTPIGDLEQSI